MNNNLDNKTDLAWKRLYSKLDRDGLIPENRSDSVKHKLRHKNSNMRALLTGSAAIVILVLLISVIYINNKSNDNLINKINNDNSSLIATLEDGSIVYLSSKSSLSYPEHFSNNKREVALHGEAFFNVSKDKKCPFIIETEEAIIEVIGTSFNICNNKNTPFSLSVLEGKVKVTSKINKNKVFVKAGETVRLKDNVLLVTPNIDSLKFYQYQSFIKFKDEPLKNIIKVIELNEPQLSINITPGIEERKITVEFSEESAESMIRLICKALNLKYSKNNNNITLTNNEEHR